MIKAGEEIVCSLGHVCGRLLIDLNDGDSILVPETGSHPFSLDPNKSKPEGINTADARWVCVNCDDPVACIRGKTWRVRTRTRWVGE
jgi:hypothetical protein